MNASIHNLADYNANQLHFIDSEAVATRKVARWAAWQNVSINMGFGVVDAIKAARRNFGSAVNAGLGNNHGNLRGRKVAGINPLIALPQKDSSARQRFGIALLPRSVSGALLDGEVGPTFLAPIPAFAAGAVTFFAFIGQPKGAASIAQEHVRRCWQFSVATIADAVRGFRGDAIFPFHSRNLA